MSLNEIVNQLKQNYRTRYYGNRGQAIPDLKPGDNAVSFVNNYLNVTGGGNSVTQIDSSKSDNTIKKNRKQPDVTYHGLFSDEESDDGSDDEGTHLVAKLIEKSLTMNIEKPTEKLYSSDTSVVQEPPSPTSNIHAKKWLSFKNSTFAANNVFTNQVARRSEEFPNNAQQWKASNSIKENLNHADITYDLLAASSDNGPENEFVIEEENRCNIDTGVSPPKKKKLSPFPTKTKRDERTPTPKKTNSNEAFSSLQKTSKNMKASLISSTTAERLSPKVSEAPAPSTVNSSEEEFEIEDISDINESNLFTIPMKAKSIQTGINKKEKVTVQKLPNKPINFEPNNPLMPSHTEGNETLLQKDALSSDVKGIEQQPISQHAALREGSEEQAASSRVTHLPQVAGEDSENEDSIPLPVQIQVGDSDNTGSGSLNNIEPVEQPQQRRKSPRKKRDQRAEQTYGLLDETFSIKNRKGKTILHVVEIHSSFHKTSKDVKVSPICSTLAKRLSPKVSEAPAPSTVVNSSEEEFEIEDITDIIELDLFTIPENAKSIQTGVIRKEKVTVQKLPNNPLMPSHTEGNENLLQKDALSSDVKGIEQQPISQHAALREGSEEQAASSRVTHLPQVAGEDSENEDSIPLLVPIEERDIDNTGSGGLNNIEQLQQRRKSPRKKRDQRAEQTYGLLDETFSIKNTRGKPNNIRAADKKKNNSKQLEEERKNQLDKAKKAKKKVSEKKTPESNKQRKSSKANQNELECAKDYLSNDNEAKEVKDTSATRRSSRKRNNTGEMLNADKQKNVEATVCRQPDHERLDMNSFDGQQTEEEMHIPTKERNAKLRNNGPSYPSDHSSEESVFQSGPVSRQRTVRFVEPGKPIAYDLDVPDIESGAEDQEPIVDSEKEREPLSGGPETAINISEEERAPLEDCPVIFDPESESDVLLECIAQSELSTFVGDGSCKCWTNFDNSIFTTGKLIIAPKKKNRCLLLSNIVIYYVEKGKVQLNLHKTERILKNGDFFFVPPENSCTIANLENKEAVLVFNTIKIPPLSKD